jgi:hypothetical protein
MTSIEHKPQLTKQFTNQASDVQLLLDSFYLKVNATLESLPDMLPLMLKSDIIKLFKNVAAYCSSQLRLAGLTLLNPDEAPDQTNYILGPTSLEDCINKYTASKRHPPDTTSTHTLIDCLSLFEQELSGTAHFRSIQTIHHCCFTLLDCETAKKRDLTFKNIRIGRIIDIPGYKHLIRSYNADVKTTFFPFYNIDTASLESPPLSHLDSKDTRELAIFELVSTPIRNTLELYQTDRPNKPPNKSVSNPFDDLQIQQVFAIPLVDHLNEVYDSLTPIIIEKMRQHRTLSSYHTKSAIPDTIEPQASDEYPSGNQTTVAATTTKNMMAATKTRPSRLPPEPINFILYPELGYNRSYRLYKRLAETNHWYEHRLFGKPKKEQQYWMGLLKLQPYQPPNDNCIDRKSNTDSQQTDTFNTPPSTATTSNKQPTRHSQSISKKPLKSPPKKKPKENSNKQSNQQSKKRRYQQTPDNRQSIKRSKTMSKTHAQIKAANNKNENNNGATKRANSHNSTDQLPSKTKKTLIELHSTSIILPTDDTIPTSPALRTTPSPDSTVTECSYPTSLDKHKPNMDSAALTTNPKTNHTKKIISGTVNSNNLDEVPITATLTDMHPPSTDAITYTSTIHCSTKLSDIPPVKPSTIADNTSVTTATHSTNNLDSTGRALQNDVNLTNKISLVPQNSPTSDLRLSTDSEALLSVSLLDDTPMPSPKLHVDFATDNPGSTLETSSSRKPSKKPSKQSPKKSLSKKSPNKSSSTTTSSLSHNVQPVVINNNHHDQTTSTTVSKPLITPTLETPCLTDITQPTKSATTPDLENNKTQSNTQCTDLLNTQSAIQTSTLNLSGPPDSETCCATTDSPNCLELTPDSHNKCQKNLSQIDKPAALDTAKHPSTIQPTTSKVRTYALRSTKATLPDKSTPRRPPRRL